MPDTRTYRGRSLEDVLPQIREELGADAVVLARREGLAGGVGGFFQKQFVEVEARAGAEDDPVLLARNDRATSEGLESPAVQELVRQAGPFAAELSAALNSAEQEPRTPTLADLLGLPAQETGGYGRDARATEFVADVVPEVADPVAAAAALLAAAKANAPADAKLNAHAGPDSSLLQAQAEANAAAAALAAAARSGTGPDLSPAPERLGTGPDLSRTVVSPGAVAVLPARAAALSAIERRLVASGFSGQFADELCGEVEAHLLPFAASNRQLTKLVRSALARRLRSLEALGAAPRSMAIAGAGGSGKTHLTASIALAYANAGRMNVLVLALRPRDNGTALKAMLDPTEVTVAVVDDIEGARKRLSAHPDAMVIVDCPPFAPRDAKSVAALAKDLQALAVEEVHLCVPASTGAAAAVGLHQAAAALHPTHIALTHADATDAAGAVLELAAQTQAPISYVAEYESVSPSDAADLAARLI